MGENIKEVIARMKAQQQSQQKVKPAVPTGTIPKFQKRPEESVYEGDEEVLEEETTEKQVPAPQNQVQSPQQPQQISDNEVETVLREMELLNNNGRYRLELLTQLQEINKALTTIASVLVDISGKFG